MGICVNNETRVFALTPISTLLPLIIIALVWLLFSDCGIDWEAHLINHTLETQPRLAGSHSLFGRVFILILKCQVILHSGVLLG